MKNIYKFWIIAFLFLALSFNGNAAITYSLDNSCGSSQLVVLVTPDVNYSGGLAVWSPAVFTISWPMALGSGILGAVTNQNGYAFATAGLTGNDGVNYYQKYAHTAATTLAMTAGTSYEVVRIALAGSVGTFGNFEIPASTNAWIAANEGFSVFSNSAGNQVVSPYSAYTLTNIPLFAGIFWDGTSWCGGSGVGEQPGTTDGSLNCYVNGPGAVLSTTGASIGQLQIGVGANLTINPLASLTAAGATFISDPNGLTIAASALGTGSFIDNGTITYGTNGSATVQQYFVDNVTNVAFHNHFVGPLVSDPVFETNNGGTKGVYLQAFDLVNTASYAYEFIPSTNAWNNIVPFTYPIPTTKGITLSTTMGVNYTMSQTGKLITGTISSANGGTILGAGNNLLSNPFPCGLNLQNFLLVNSNIMGSITTTARVWEGLDLAANGGNYSTYVAFVGGTGGLTGGVLRLGQGFFVESNAGAPVSFNSMSASFPERTHSTAILLKESQKDLLRLKVIGNGFSDELIVHFNEEATNHFDSFDAEKWSSMYPEATEAWTIAEDNSLLTINTLIPLGSEIVSVPMSFKCGADNTYNIIASNLSSFELGSEIYLEDLKLGGGWIDLITNPNYQFTASPDDEEARFVLHFFGPTGIDDPVAEAKAVQIYSWGQDAYIVNRGNETIKEYVAYDMMGRELHRGTLPNNTVNKVQIGNVSAYYIVKVITKEGGVYTDKVYITK